MKENDSFSMCHPLLNFFYFAVALLFTMFNQHPVFLGISYAGAFVYGGLLNGWRKTLKQGLLLTLPGLLIIVLLNPMFNHYGVTMLYYIESSGNWITLEAIVYGIVLGAVMFIVIQWFSCYNTVMTSDKFIYLFGRIIPALSLVLSMALRFVPRFLRQLKVIRVQLLAHAKRHKAGIVAHGVVRPTAFDAPPLPLGHKREPRRV